MKTCSRCNQTKGLENFRPRVKGRSPLHTWCTACFKETAELRKTKLDPARRGLVLAKKCRTCLITKPTDSFSPSASTNDGWKGSCRPCERLKARDRMLSKTYDITLDEYEEILTKQGGVCAICRQESKDTGKPLAVDHDHETGEVRELLCGPCNRGLGLFEDRAELLLKAAAYLNKHKE